MTSGGTLVRKQVSGFLTFLAQERRLSANTVAAYQNDLTQLLGYLDSPRAAALHAEVSTDGTKLAVRPAHVVDFVLQLRERGYAPATIARKVAATRSLFHYLTEGGEIDGDPTAGLGSPSVRKPLPRALSVREVTLLLGRSASKPGPDGMRDRAMLQLLYSTGMRVTELVSLNVDDVDLTTDQVRCVGRGGRVRQIPIENGARRVTVEYLQHGRNAFARSSSESALFVNQRGDRLTRQGFWLIMKGLAKGSGVTATVTPHTLRHSFAAHRLGDGIALERLRQLLGHANISTTQIYTQVRMSGEPQEPSGREGDRVHELTPVAQ